MNPMSPTHPLDEADLDAGYTHLCHTMTRLGEPLAPLFLARLALLALTRCPDLASARALVDDAAFELGAHPAAGSALPVCGERLATSPP